MLALGHQGAGMIGGKFLGRIGRAGAGIGRCFVNQHAAVYAVWYVVSILGFALLYCLLPGEAFHAPYVVREPQTLESRYSFQPFITEQMRLSAKTWSDSNYVNFDMNDISILRVGADPQRNTVRVVLAYKLAHKPQQAVAVDLNVLSLPTGGDLCHDARIAQEESSPDAEGNGDIIDILFHDTPGCGTAHYLRLSKSDEQSFRYFAAGLSGRAKYLPHYGLRMIAYSAMTMSTTNDGSIVPTKRTARVLVAIEPIWGLLLIGLTFRAVVRREFAKAVRRA
jgi:hypothetical protein